MAGTKKELGAVDQSKLNWEKPAISMMGSSDTKGAKFDTAEEQGEAFLHQVGPS